MADELIDIYDVNHNHIGTAMKSEAHAKGLWHNNIHCWIFDPKKKLVLFQLRAADKKVDPSKLDISVAGHVGAGEDVADTCVREVSEELGMYCSVDELQFIGIHRDVIQSGDIQNCEFGHTYLLQRNIDIDEFILQEEEVAGAYVMALDDCFKLFAGEVETISGVGVEIGQNGTLKRDFVPSDFAQFDSSYMITIMVMIERVIEGKKYVGIA